jgi:hypothetical protein
MIIPIPTIPKAPKTARAAFREGGVPEESGEDVVSSKEAFDNEKSDMF